MHAATGARGVVTSNAPASHGERAIQVKDAATATIGTVVCDAATVHGERPAGVINAAARGKGIIPVYAAAVHGKCAGIVHAAALAAIVLTSPMTGKDSFPESQGAFIVNTAAFPHMDDLANRLAVMAVGYSKRDAGLNLNGVVVTAPSYGLAVEAEHCVVAARPGLGESDVGCEVIHARVARKASAAVPCDPFILMMRIISAIGVTADGVNMGIGDRGKSGFRGEVAHLGYGGNRRVVGLRVDVGLVGLGVLVLA